jgi:glycosyltransferase involved in cell wall biosynthesis
VHTNSLKAGFYGCLAARLAGVPSVWHLRDRLAPDYLPRFALLAARLGLAILPTRVVCNSQATLATVPRGLRAVSRRRPVVVPSPLHDVLQPSRPDDSLPGTEAVGARTAFKVGLVGRFAPWKGQLEAVRAFAVEGMPADAQLVLIGAPMFGEAAYEEEVRQEVRRLGLDGRVDFLGFVDDVLGAIVGLDVLVHASTVPEPFGQVIVEGMAAGVPVVATRGGGPSEIITDGVNGLLYTAGDVEELAGVIRRLHEDGELRARLRKEGLRRAADFTPGVIAPTVVSLYAEMIAHRSGAA